MNEVIADSIANRRFKRKQLAIGNRQLEIKV